MKKTMLKLAGGAALVFWIAAAGNLNLPGVILATLALNAICGAALKTEDTNGKVRTQK